MSLQSVPYIIKDGWGLEDNDLDKIIRIEKLKDVTQEFSDQVEAIIDGFGSISRLRIVAFNEQSGVDYDSKAFFKALILAGRDVFYYSLLSNKECCVVMVSSPKGEKQLKAYKHILCHEYAHHFQIANAGFPYLIYKKRPRMWVPPFVKPYEVGPAVGSAFIDDLQLPDLHTVIQDSNERISDIICEGLLRERNLVYDFFEEFRNNVALKKDPALHFAYRRPCERRYVRRLVLRDNAEWGATVRLAYPKNEEVNKVISKCKKFAVKLNKRLPEASRIYDEIFNLCTNTDFHKFKSPQEVVNYTKRIFDLLNIKIESSESW